MPARAQPVNDAQADFDDAASQYLSAETRAREIDADLSTLHQEIDALDAQVRTARAIATERAVDVYAGGGGGFETLLSSDSAIDAARRTELAGRANVSAQDAIDRLDSATHALRSRRAELERERATQAKVVAELDGRREALQARLARAQAEYRDQQADARIAASRSAAVTGAAPSSTAARRAARASSPSRPRTSSPRPSREGASPPAPAGAPAPEPVAAPPPPVAGRHPHHDDPFLVCTRARESNGDYTAVNPAGYYGAYQMSPTTWDSTAEHAGRPELIGVLPSRASEYDQDDLAWDLYQWQGKEPWLNRC
jgi:peptidoglycan hydrolase CwlO-like protein